MADEEEQQITIEPPDTFAYFEDAAAQRLYAIQLMLAAKVDFEESDRELAAKAIAAVIKSIDAKFGVPTLVK